MVHTQYQGEGGRGVHEGCGASKARIFKGKCDFQAKGKGVADVMQKKCKGGIQAATEGVIGGCDH